jgi:hypothetical protein
MRRDETRWDVMASSKTHLGHARVARLHDGLGDARLLDADIGGGEEQLRHSDALPHHAQATYAPPSRAVPTAETRGLPTNGKGAQRGGSRRRRLRVAGAHLVAELEDLLIRSDVGLLLGGRT